MDHQWRWLGNRAPTTKKLGCFGKSYPRILLVLYLQLIQNIYLVFTSHSITCRSGLFIGKGWLFLSQISTITKLFVLVPIQLVEEQAQQETTFHKLHGVRVVVPVTPATFTVLGYWLMVTGLKRPKEHQSNLTLQFLPPSKETPPCEQRPSPALCLHYHRHVCLEDLLDELVF